MVHHFLGIILIGKSIDIYYILYYQALNYRNDNRRSVGNVHIYENALFNTFFKNLVISSR